uniref:ARAD1D51040p n=1 Tax=Blastobotrys adeninivorans TaxID=409370 RepID=A0A060TJ03_BLAAD
MDKETSSHHELEISKEQDVHDVHATQAAEGDLTRWQAIRMYPKACLWILGIVWILCLCGFDNQAGGIVVGIPQFRQDFGYEYNGEYVLSTMWQSAFNGVPIAAAIIGNFVGSWVSDAIGRKLVLLSAVLISVAAVGMEFASTAVQLFLAGKTVNGFCLGMIQAVGATYVSEIAPLALRGLATSVCNISYCIGPYICFFINYGISSGTTAWAYRALFCAQWGFAAVALLFLPFMPESPWTYVIKGDSKKALRSYQRLLPTLEDAQRQLQVAEITYAEAQELTKGASFFECFKGTNLRRTMVACVPMILQPMCGVQFTISYTTYYFQLVGFSSHKSFQFTIAAQTLSIAGNFVAYFIVDRFGRRPNVLYGMLTMTIFDFITGGLGTNTENHSMLMSTVAFILMYGFFYNAAIGVVAWPIATENATSRLRSKTVALAFIGNQGLSMMWSFVLPYIFNPNAANLGAKVMFIFAAFCIISLPYIYFCHPETAGRSFEEIDELYSKHVPARKFSSFITDVNRARLDEPNV